MIKKTIYTFLLLAFLVPALLYVFLLTDYGQRNTIAFITHQIERKTGQHVEIGRVNYNLPFKWKIKGIKWVDNNKNVINIRSFDINVSFFDLLYKKIVITSLNLDQIQVDSNTENVTTEKKEPSLDIAITPLPIYIKIYNFSINDLIVKSFKENSLFIQGSFENIPQEVISFNLIISENEFLKSPTSIVATLSPSYKKMIVEEPGNGFIQTTFLPIKTKNISYKFVMIAKENLRGNFELLLKRVPLPHMKWLEGAIAEGSWGFNNNNLTINNLEIYNDRFHAKTNFQYSQVDNGSPVIDLNLTGRMNEFSLLELPEFIKVKDTLDINLLAKGPINNIQSELNLSIPRLEVDNATLDNSNLSMTTKISQEIAGDFIYKSNFLSQEHQLKGFFGVDPKTNSLHINEITYSNLDNVIKGYFIVNDSKDIEAKFSGEWNSYDLITHYLSYDIQGKSTFDFSIKNELLQGKISSSDLKSPTTSFKDLLIETTAFLKNEEKRGSILFSSNTIEYNKLILEKVDLFTSYDEKNLIQPFHFSIINNQKPSFSLQGEGNYSLNSVTKKITLNRLINSSFENDSLELTMPLELVIEKEDILGALGLKIGSGLWQMNFNSHLNDVNTSIKLDKVPASLLNLFTPSLITKGFIDGNLIGKKNIDQISGEASFRFSDVILNETVAGKVPALNAFIDSQINSSFVKVKSKIEGFAENPISMELQLPLATPSSQSSFVLDYEKPVKGTLEAEGNLSTFLQTVFVDNTILEGTTKIKGMLEGTLNDPLIEGFVTIDKGILETPQIGSVIKNIKASITGNGKTITLVDFSGTDDQGGTIRGNGSLQLDSQKSYPLSFNFNLKEMRILHLDYVQGIFNGILGIEGSIKDLLVKGKLTTSKLEASIPENSSTSIDTVEVTYINIPTGEKNQIYKTPTSQGIPLKLDLQIDIPSNGQLVGQDLSSDWKGNIRVEGPLNAVQYFGELQVIKGEYLFNGKTFDISKGSVNLNGDFDKKNNLYIIASIDLGKIIAEIIVKGTLHNPVLSFRSNPPLSQREILSWLIFGHGISEATPFEGEQINQSITDLKSQGGGGPDLLTKIRTKLGIDQIDFSRGEGEDEMSLKVGKYIYKGVFVTLNKSINEDTNRIGIEANIANEIKVEGELSDDSTGKILLKWKRDY